MKKLMFIAALSMVILAATSCEELLKTDDEPTEVEIPNLTSYYPFNGNANNEKNASLNGTVEYVDFVEGHTGEEKTAISFRGQSVSYLTLPNDVDYTLSLDFNRSLSFWVKDNDMRTGTYELIAKTKDTDKTSGWGVLYELSSLTFFSRASTNTEIKLENCLNYHSWTHVAITIGDNTETNNLKIYINGELKTTGNFGGVRQNYYPVTVGKGMMCHVDEIRFYGRALTADEVKQLEFRATYKN